MYRRWRDEDFAAVKSAEAECVRLREKQSSIVNWMEAMLTLSGVMLVSSVVILCRSGMASAPFVGPLLFTGSGAGFVVLLLGAVRARLEGRLTCAKLAWNAALDKAYDNAEERPDCEEGGVE